MMRIGGRKYNLKKIWKSGCFGRKNPAFLLGGLNLFVLNIKNWNYEI